MALGGHHSTRQSKASPLCRSATINLKLSACQRQTDRPPSDYRDHASHPDRRNFSSRSSRNRHTTFFATLTAQMHCRLPFQHNIPTADADHIGNAGTSIVHHAEEDAVTLTRRKNDVEGKRVEVRVELG